MRMGLGRTMDVKSDAIVKFDIVIRIGKLA